jgi:hypothetical protein
MSYSQRGLSSCTLTRLSENIFFCHSSNTKVGSYPNDTKGFLCPILLASGQYPNKWSVHDLGSSYPNAVGHNDGADEAMPVEGALFSVLTALGTLLNSF